MSVAVVNCGSKASFPVAAIMLMSSIEAKQNVQKADLLLA
jgi:hypothetical protein